MLENIMGMFGGGKEGKGGSMLMNMLIPMIAKPETVQMLQSKTKEMFVHLAERFECKVEDVSISLQLVSVKVTIEKDSEGKDVIELNEKGELKEPQDRFLILFFVDKDGKRTAVQKAWADEYISDVIQQMKQ